MKRNNILLLITDLNLVSKLKEERNITFLFPIKDFSIGFPKTFEVEDIPDNSYIFVNRILDNDAIVKLRELLISLPKTIKGIVFDDIGVLNVLLSINVNLTKILFLNHLNCNYESINCYLEYIDSVVPSTDITISEIEEILSRTKKPLVLYTFGHVNIMYSRRTLITNYNKHFKEDVPLIASLEEMQNKQKFKIIENPEGTVIYTASPFNALSLRNKENVLFNLINTIFLSEDEVLEILNSKDNLEIKYPYKYLSEQKTIFKLKEEEK